jgi:hypothetical protein
MDKKRMEAGQKLLDAAHEFWNACYDEGQYGAVQWLTGSRGELVIFTRGEYRGQLMENITKLSEDEPVHFFGEPMPKENER